jgi:hypothetical protein
MRAVALLVCSGLVRVGAFASLPDSEQIESRNAGSTHVKVRSNAYCGNRVCSGKSCAQSRVTANAAACAAAVMKDPKCGNSFSFSMNVNDPNLQYCDCAPVGAPCVATPFAFYDVYELVFDKAAVYTQQQLENAEAQARADAKKGMVTQEKYDSKAAECDNAAAPPPKVVACVPDASACGAGTWLDPVTKTCVPLGWDDDVHATKLELMAALYKNPNDPYPYKELKEDMSGIEDWDVSRIDDFKEVFSGAGSFNADLSKWDVAQGTDFTDMFGGAGSFNADLSKWNVAKGTKFEFMVRVARPRGGVAS